MIVEPVSYYTEISGYNVNCAEVEETSRVLLLVMLLDEEESLLLASRMKSL